MAKSNVDTSHQQFFHASDAPAFGVGIEATLQDDIIKGVGNDIHLGAGQQANKFEGIGIVVRVHRGTMASRHTSLPALLDGIRCHYFGEARNGIIGLVAMAVNIAVELSGKREGIMDILDAHIARPLVVGNASNDIAAKFHGLLHQLAPIGKRQDAILGKGNQLQVADIAHFFTDFKQRS